MKVTPAGLAELLQLLAETPGQLNALCAVLDEEQLHWRPDAKSWSAGDILAHLRACADVWGDTIQAMLAEDSPTLEHRSPRTWMKEAGYSRLAFGESLVAFSSRRRALLATLQGLAFEDWSRGAMMKGRRHTIFSQARRMAHHETIHYRQLEQWAAAVGHG